MKNIKIEKECPNQIQAITCLNSLFNILIKERRDYGNI